MPRNSVNTQSIREWVALLPLDDDGECITVASVRVVCPSPYCRRYVSNSPIEFYCDFVPRVPTAIAAYDRFFGGLAVHYPAFYVIIGAHIAIPINSSIFSSSTLSFLLSNTHGSIVWASATGNAWRHMPCRRCGQKYPPEAFPEAIPPASLPACNVPNLLLAQHLIYF